MNYLCGRRQSLGPTKVPVFRRASETILNFRDTSYHQHPHNPRATQISYKPLHDIVTIDTRNDFLSSIICVDIESRNTGKPIYVVFLVSGLEAVRERHDGGAAKKGGWSLSSSLTSGRESSSLVDTKQLRFVRRHHKDPIRGVDSIRLTIQITGLLHKCGPLLYFFNHL